MTGTPWIAKEWLSQVIYAAAFAAAGWPGVALAAIVAVAAAFALVAREAATRLSPLAAVLLVVAIFPIAAGHVLARPHVLAWVPMIVVAIAFLRAAEEARAPSLLVLPAMVLWANLHGSFLLGLAILPFFMEVFLHHLLDLRFLRVFRLTRLLKLTRGNDATATLVKVV